MNFFVGLSGLSQLGRIAQYVLRSHNMVAWAENRKATNTPTPRLLNLLNCLVFLSHYVSIYYDKLPLDIPLNLDTQHKALI